MKQVMNSIDFMNIENVPNMAKAYMARTHIMNFIALIQPPGGATNQ